MPREVDVVWLVDCFAGERRMVGWLAVGWLLQGGGEASLRALTEAMQPVDNGQSSERRPTTGQQHSEEGLDELDLIREGEYKWSVSTIFALGEVVGWSVRKPCCNV
jgi:hypothetical protein